jgi:DNA-binding HxlR family transcriptional regulator
MVQFKTIKKVRNLMLSRKDYEEVRGYFTRKDLKLSDKLFYEAINGLIEKGLIEVKEDRCGETLYRLTPMGIKVGETFNISPDKSN